MEFLHGIAVFLFAILNTSESSLTNHRLVTLWGQNGGGGELALATHCASNSTFDTIIIGYVWRFFFQEDKDNYPAISLSKHCGWPLLAGRARLHRCPKIEQAIKQCQANGKRVLIGMGGSVGDYRIPDNIKARLLAQRIWGLFLGGNDQRPFGSAIIDGVNLDIEKQTVSGYEEFLKEMRRLMLTSSKTNYVISVTSRCLDLESGENLGGLLKSHPEFFDEVYVLYYQKKACRSKGRHFERNIATWFDWSLRSKNKPKIYIGLLAAKLFRQQQYYQSPKNVGQMIDKVKKRENFGGVFLFDSGQDQLNIIDGKKYSYHVRKYFTTSVTSVPPLSNSPAPTSITSVPPLSNSTAPPVGEERGSLHDVDSNMNCNLSTSDCVVRISYKLHTVVSENDVILTSQNVTSIESIVNKIAKHLGTVETEKQDQVLKNVLSTTNKAIQANKTALRKNFLVDSVQRFAESLNTTENKSFEFSDTQLAFQAKTVRKGTVKIQARKTTGGNLNIIINSLDEDTTEKESLISEAEIPELAFQSSPSMVVYGFLYRQDSLFVQRIGKHHNKSVEGSVLSISIANHSVKGLPVSQPVKLSLRKSSALKQVSSTAAACQFWDLEKRRWSSAGCVKTRETCDSVRCECTHLTNFALVLDTSQKGLNPLELKVASLVGCAVSLTAFFLTIIFILIISALRKPLHNKILLNLCTALICLLLAFLTGAERGCVSTVKCSIVASLIQYFLLASFAWLAIEGWNLFGDFVLVFRDVDEERFIIKSAVIGWGIPAIIVGITWGAGGKEYFGNAKYCLVHGEAFYFAVVLPCAVVLTSNIVVLSATMTKIALSRRFRPTNKNSPKSNSLKPRGMPLSQVMDTVKVTLAFSCLLGITWIFALLAVGDATVVFQWLFCVFNSFQGLTIFYFNVVRSKHFKIALVTFFNERRKKPLQTPSPNTATAFTFSVSDEKSKKGEINKIKRFRRGDKTR